jgi:formylglycine-generating enzyme required for sulfatase activity
VNAPRSRPAKLLVAGVVAAAGIASVVWLARSRSEEPARCAAGMIPLGVRCCGEGQRLEDSPLGPRCSGAPARCAAPLIASEQGCVPPSTVVELAGGSLRVGPGDWEAEGVVRAGERQLASFAIDAFEVTEARWQACTTARACATIPLRGEPGLPVIGVTFDEAASFCAWAGGALPTADQLAWAAAGPRARRYPWGDTGAVCRRAVWGLRDGPCARGASGPDLAGSRPDGASAEGVFDLAGNVAEWASSITAAPGHAEVRGGAWGDAVAARLRSWNRMEFPTATRSYEVGLRCAYAR